MLTIFTSLAFFAACNNRIDIKGFVEAELYKSKEKPLVTFYKDSGKTASYNADPRYKMENEDSKGNLIETLYLPSGIDIHTEIPVKLMVGIDYRAYIEVAPDHQKLFETIQGSAPTFDDNLVLLPDSCLTANGENSQLNFSFNLHADLADNKTAEGQTIPVTLKLVRLVNGEDADTKATIPFTISCNSPPPSLSVQIVKAKAANEAVALVTVNASQEELYLKHRDLDILDYLHLKGGMPASQVGDLLNGVSFDASHKMQIQKFTLVNDASAYEVIGTGTAPVITESTYALNLGSAEGTSNNELLSVALVDTAGLKPEAAHCTENFLELEPITLTDSRDNRTLDATVSSTAIENLLKVQSNSGQTTINLPTQAFYGEGDARQTVSVSGLTLKYQESGGTEQTYSGSNITLANQSTKTITLWVEKAGYLASQKQTYTLTAQTEVYTASAETPAVSSGVVASVDSLGFSATAPTTIDKAIARANDLVAVNDVSVVVLEGMTTATFTTIGKGGSTNKLTLKSADGAAYPANVRSADKNKCTVYGNVEFNNILVSRHFQINLGNNSPNSASTLTLLNAEISGENDPYSLGDKDGITINRNGTLVMKNGSTIKSFKRGVVVGTESNISGVTPNDFTFTMDGGNIENCNNDTSSTGQANAAGVCIFKGTFTMSGGTIKNNKSKCKSGANNFGGGVYVGSGTTFNMSGSASIYENNADNNQAPNASGTSSGGGVCVVGTFNMTGGSIGGNGTANTAKKGGGVAVLENGTFNMSGGSITYNTVDNNGSGAGIYNSGTTTLSGNASVSHNTATDTQGGGIYNTGTCNICDSAKVEHNEASGGAGIYNNSSGDKILKIYGSASINNNTSSSNGGGIFVNSGDVEIYGNATISGNTATGNGGGIYASSLNSSDTPVVYIYGNATIGERAQSTAASSTSKSNSATLGGGIYTYYSNSNPNQGSCNVYIGYKPNSISGGNHVLDKSGSPVIGYNYAGNGGGIYVHSGALYMATGSVSYNTSEKTGSFASGGGIAVAANGTAGIGGDAKIIGNQAISKDTNQLRGGGIWVSGSVRIEENVEISYNVAKMGSGNPSDNNAGGGGGIYTSQTGTVTIIGDTKGGDGVRIINNKADGGGGGICCSCKVDIQVGKVTITGNETSGKPDLGGGGIYVWGNGAEYTGSVTINANADVTMKNNTIGANQRGENVLVLSGKGATFNRGSWNAEGLVEN